MTVGRKDHTYIRSRYNRNHANPRRHCTLLQDVTTDSNALAESPEGGPGESDSLERPHKGEQHCGERRHRKWRLVREQSRKRSETVQAGPQPSRVSRTRRTTGQESGQDRSEPRMVKRRGEASRRASGPPSSSEGTTRRTIPDQSSYRRGRWRRANR
jgi:hypothetical protein